MFLSAHWVNFSVHGHCTKAGGDFLEGFGPSACFVEACEFRMCREEYVASGTIFSNAMGPTTDFPTLVLGLCID